MSAAMHEGVGPTIPLPPPDGAPQAPGNLVGMILKAPRRFAELVQNDWFNWRSSAIVLVAALFFDALYGVAMGAFSGGDALWMAAVKIPLVAVTSVALCAPSLYVLLGLSGSAISLRQVAAVLCGAACLTSLLLVGFAPVSWLFGVSTSNIQFMVLLHLFVWAIGVAYGLRLLGISVPGGFAGNRIIVLWACVFLLVTAQMLTYFRPVMVAAPGGAFRADEKQFFFEHFLSSMTPQPQREASYGDSVTALRDSTQP